MTIKYHFRDETMKQVINRWEYPSGCLPDIIEVADGDDSFIHYAEYEPEHRPRPPTLWDNLTSRERVYRRSGTSPLCWNQDTYPCPHNGVHGNVTLYSYHTGGSSLFVNQLYDENNLISRNLWASSLREKLAGNKYNLGSSVAEYRESVKLFVGAAKSLHSAYRTIRGHMPRRKLRACSVPAAVLQYNFGVAPLVEDLYSSVEVLRHRLEEPLFRRLSVGIKIPFSGPFTYGPYDYDANGLFRQRATVNYRIDPNYSLSSDFDFGNPIEWAWELIPFSFVVDWAIPIGNWLGSLDALLGITDINGTVTTRTKDSWTYRSNVAFQYIGRIGTYESLSYQRSVMTSIPMPEFPAWSPSLSFKRATNAVSLLLGISSQCRGNSAQT